jgi:hypothetical protein
MTEENQYFLEANPSDQNSWTSLETIHCDLLATKNLVYDPCRFDTSTPILEAQNAEYGAYVFNLNGVACRFRVAKITSTKVGQFVTLWERMGNGPIQPYDILDSVELTVISTREGNNFGQFIFPKAVLGEHDILSIKRNGGKRAIRVYPPWVETTSRQAQKTQLWQLEYFLEMPLTASIDYIRAKMLYNPNDLIQLSHAPCST